MNDLFPFILLIIIIVSQRIFELYIAKRNEKWIKQQGAVEFGQKHYKFMVLLHLSFFISLITENFLFERGISVFWPVLLSIFCVSQAIRIWAMTSLGKHWNTKILVLANERIVNKGPYRFLKHPNYLVVALEIFTVPMLFNCFYTAILFSLLNILMLMIRIPMEEKALKTLTRYNEVFQNHHRFLPKFIK
ncbi:isoprenylcysteine carboxyl methyltransferase family protein [Neobacillus cucumis]|uniref:isoprenylcysteine carboxyl methyltransferase family protein n=1 Tax=Neobacillus cucumis TaxID=1740721 RepID=UPI001962FB56|nr:isoprenylcysteine carboxylmethyltransferase family protein [Neobacillus cucumis]MBM7654862.1 methyltransferase [Neobacillus cucumis]